MLLELPLLENILTMAFTDTEKGCVVAEYNWTDSITAIKRWINRTMSKPPTMGDKILS